jgi:formylglycine-generating enzyme required for sulfatase activity
MKKYIVIFSTLSIFILTNAFMFSSTKKIEKQFKKKFSLIEPNTTQAKEDSNAVNAFYIMRQEVTNGEYKEFLDDLQNQGLTDLVSSYSPDPQGWQKHHISMTPFDEHYFSHVAYRNYPVVNISHEAAQAYCDWLTKRHQHERHEGGLVAKFSLPQKSEWTAAATLGISGAVYAWGGASISNKQGCMLCNFGQAHEQTMPILNEKNQITELSNHSLDARYDDNASFTAPVNSYSASFRWTLLYEWQCCRDDNHQRRSIGRFMEFNRSRSNKSKCDELHATITDGWLPRSSTSGARADVIFRLKK